jgi:hypothetical protein
MFSPKSLLEKRGVKMLVWWEGDGICFFFSKEAKTYFFRDEKVSKKSSAKRSCQRALPK